MPDLLVRLRLEGAGDTNRLKRSLKALLRSFGLRCIDLADIDPETPTPRPAATREGA